MSMEMNLEALLKEGAGQFSAVLDELQVESFLKYKELLKEWNQKINLTAIEDDKEIIIKHYIDSLSILPYLSNSNISLIDVGTGGGFPGIPVKIAYSNMKITLLDSLEKRVKFLNEVIHVLDLKEINAVHGRAEDIALLPRYRESFDVAVARAVANLPVLLEYCLPFTKVGGIFIAMKGSNINELDSASKALDILGGKLEEVKEITLPFGDAKRNLMIIKKLRQTPTKYPRKAGKPLKEPLI